MSKKKTPVTMGTRMLDEFGATYGPHVFKWDKKEGAEGAAKQLGVPPESVIKTLVFETCEKKPLIVLMDSTHEVSTKELARHLGVKSVEPCDPDKAQSLTGYLIGGISPFGTRRELPVYMERSLLSEHVAYINAGKRGFLVSLDPKQMSRILNAELVDVGIDG